jgi:hypothetical protein
MRALGAVLVVLLAAGCDCGRPRLISSAGGAVRVTLLGVDAPAAQFQVVVWHDTEQHQTDAAIVAYPVPAEIDELDVGTWNVHVAVAQSGGVIFHSRDLGPQDVRSGEVTDLTVDFRASACSGGASDDDRCGVISCSGLDARVLRGDNTPAGTSKSCVQTSFASLTSGRCVDGACAAPNGPQCTHSSESTLEQAGVCHVIEGCEDGGTVSVVTSPDGTPCGGANVCMQGSCGPTTTGNEVGCADGTREGFVSMSDHPTIAGCSGAWTVAGVTRPNLVPTCNRGAGNSGANTEGTGCSVADLCAEGWHVCAGSAEVSLKSATGCADAVPPGTPDKSLLFVVSQPSQMNAACSTSGDNDVFGCGNLGIVLDASKGCGPLTRALASEQAGSCGYNEAEPNLGPWQCIGGADSHLHEGALVTKKGCPNHSCSYDGAPIGSSDKGGVLCCQD